MRPCVAHASDSSVRIPQLLGLVLYVKSGIDEVDFLRHKKCSCRGSLFLCPCRTNNQRTLFLQMTDILKSPKMPDPQTRYGSSFSKALMIPNTEHIRVQNVVVHDSMAGVSSPEIFVQSRFDYAPITALFIFANAHEAIGQNEFIKEVVRHLLLRQSTPFAIAGGGSYALKAVCGTTHGGYMRPRVAFVALSGTGVSAVSDVLFTTRPALMHDFFFNLQNLSHEGPKIALVAHGRERGSNLTNDPCESNLFASAFPSTEVFAMATRRQYGLQPHEETPEDCSYEGVTSICILTFNDTCCLENS